MDSTPKSSRLGARSVSVLRTLERVPSCPLFAFLPGREEFGGQPAYFECGTNPGSHSQLFAPERLDGADLRRPERGKQASEQGDQAKDPDDSRQNSGIGRSDFTQLLL
jgi:hypothetical protein